MREVVCDTSPLQYLHQLGRLDLLPALVNRVIVPQTVADELRAGRDLGYDVPDARAFDWITIRQPGGAPLPIAVTGLGRGETDTLRLALEVTAGGGAGVVILDDDRARIAARRMGLRLTGTLGVLLDAKRAGLIAEVGALVGELERRGFRLAERTRREVLRLAGETAE